MIGETSANRHNHYMSRYNLHLTILLIFCLLPTFRMAASGQENLAATYSPSVLQQVLPEPLRFGALPQAKDKFWTSTIPMSMRNSYIQYGRTFKGKAWVGIPDSLFADYQKTGNRTGYEREYFARRKQKYAPKDCQAVFSFGHPKPFSF